MTFQACYRFSSGKCGESQDVHSPPVIASDFLKQDAGGFFLQSSARRLPETLSMDEEDGRPGPGARQSGPNDVLMDAPMPLCQPVFFQATSLQGKTTFAALRGKRTRSHHKGETQ